MCESVRPDVFEVDDDGELILHEDAVAGGGDELAADLEQAVESCPTQALALQR
ncbi:ferredoxin [uncultured Jatrophihabitans sp.]|uniref:ferredoxin n=1 Tax=uncultured Jatrophihabitans sp. TaxID=1610747 RepID=UPI0035CA4791